MKIVQLVMLMTLSAVILGLLIGTTLVNVPASADNPRFPKNVTLGPVSPPPGSSFTPKYPGEWKWSQPGLNVTASPAPKSTAKATVTMKPTTMMKTTVTVKPTMTTRYMKSYKPSASVMPSPRYAEAYRPTGKVNASIMPVVPTVSIKPSPMKSSAVSPAATMKPKLAR